MPSLKRLSDGAGDVGARSEAIQWYKNGKFKTVVGITPVVGCSMLVGSVTARSYSGQDYWLTTVVTEILKEKKDKEGNLIYVKFKTSNSIYEWKS